MVEQASARTPEAHLAAVRDLVGHLSAEAAAPEEAVGKRLVKDVVAVEDSPRFDNSQMDGYALREAHLAGGTFPVGPTVPAGTDPREVLTEATDDQVIPVMTGAMLPDGSLAVIPVEHCDPPTFIDEGSVTVPAVPSGQFVRPRGCDIRAGSVLLPEGHTVNPRTVGVAAAQGITTLPVRRRARVLICTGGDEVRGDGEALGAAVIRDANGPMLQALCREHGIDVAGTVRTGDDPEEFREALTEAVDTLSPDAVVTSGGISHGRFEVVRDVLEQGGTGKKAEDTADTAWFGHVSQQPGGPQGLARFRGVPVLCLPGNPVSTAVSFRLFVAPVLGEAAEPVTARLAEPAQGIAGRDRFLRGRSEVVDGTLVVTPVGGAGSHLLAQSAEADCLIRIPAGESLDEGDLVRMYPL